MRVNRRNAKGCATRRLSIFAQFIRADSFALCNLTPPSFSQADLNAPRARRLANTEPGVACARFSPRASSEFPHEIPRIWEFLRHLASFYSAQSPPLQSGTRRGGQR